MITTRPDHQTLLAAVELANRAPSSVHDTQPWRWLVGRSSIHLMADRTRHVPVTDPCGRDLLLSCGAALHHLRTALAALGWATVVHRVPYDHDTAHDTDHLAAIEPRPHVPTEDDVALAAAISRRRTDRRRFRPREIPSEYLDLLVRRAARAGAVLVPVTDGTSRWVLTRALSAVRRQAEDSRHRLELSASTGRSRVRNGGLDTAKRTFPGGLLVDEVSAEDSGQLLVIATSREDAVSVLRAGEAASATLLTATVLGLATCLLSRPLALSDTRTVVRDQVLDGTACPQLIVRAGWAPPAAAPLPRSPVRRAEDTVDYLPGTRHP
ncbi:Acg family FMN-binding oxidoreductase [Actinophytocola sp. NPDC049390]|uniref:Acg family FMN-binding oxidoreductase n=1 Tax=Actinophytocola sp. NPDC049390 TaxID=3363894 RepID=UPI0037A49D55